MTKIDTDSNLNELSIAQTDGIKQDITKIINQIVNDWNSGNLEEFMNSYDKSDKTLFISGHKFIHGWQNSYEFYKQKYGDNKQDMGQLQIEIKSIELLGTSHAFLYGVWHLTMIDKEHSGVTSLIFQIKDNNWKIVVDHSN